MGISTIEQFRALFDAEGVEQVFVKELAPKQDNEKNQILLASSLTGLVNAFPVSELGWRAPGTSERKRASEPGRPIASAGLRFFWLDGEENRFAAPGTKLIEYFQYPETRLSGFLNGAKWAPEAIRREKQKDFGKRILGLGSNRSGEMFGLLLTERDDAVVSSFPDLPASGISSLLRVLATGGEIERPPSALLEEQIGAIIAGGWHWSVRNRGGSIIPFEGNQGAGYTLEALLGVETNALKEPDIHGHEIKSFRGDRISLMTPTADLGHEGDLPFRQFMRLYGRPGSKSDGSMRFTGVHRTGAVNGTTGLLMELQGYDRDEDKFAGTPETIRVVLVDPHNGEIVSGWSLSKLAASWNAKHAFAAYIRAEQVKDVSSGRTRYRYKAPWFRCEGTNIWMLLRAIAKGAVYYDPAHSIYADDRAKVRPQWRISTRQLGETLATLYANVTVMPGSAP